MGRFSVCATFRQLFPSARSLRGPRRAGRRAWGVLGAFPWPLPRTFETGEVLREGGEAGSGSDRLPESRLCPEVLCARFAGYSLANDRPFRSVESRRAGKPAWWSFASAGCGFSYFGRNIASCPVAAQRGLPLMPLIIAAIAIYSGVVIHRIDAAGMGWSKRTPAPENLSVAVLPFHNLGDSEDESFSDGLTDELIDSLGRVQGLHVVARTSAFQYPGKTLDIREIGEKLNVRTVLEGTVRIYGNRLRITAQLDDTENGYRVWSNSYERDFKNALFHPPRYRPAYCRGSRHEVDHNGGRRSVEFSPSKAVPVSAEAYQDYLKGVYFWNKQTSDSVEMATAYFKQAIAEDPSYAAADMGLAVPISTCRPSAGLQRERLRRR